MATIELSAEPQTRKVLTELLRIALGNNHLVWVDGAREVEEKQLRILREMYFPGAVRPGPRSKVLPPTHEPDRPVAHLVFWHNGERLELDEQTHELVCQTLAERIAVMLLASQERSLARLQLVHYHTDWQQVLLEGVEVVQTGETQGNRVRLT